MKKTNPRFLLDHRYYRSLLHIAVSIPNTLFGYDYLMLLGAKINEFILQGEVWRLITPILLHSSVLHIAFNMYALYTVGPSMERIYGTRSFIILYLIGGLWGNTLSFLLSRNPSLGASTAIFGLIAAQGVYIYKTGNCLAAVRARCC
jgi:rhomboid protease GluP